MSKRTRVFAAIAIGLIVVIGFATRAALTKAKPVTLTTGMSMASALDAVRNRGIAPSKMQFGEPHHSFDLPDGRTVVLGGQLRVDSILIIGNSSRPKVNRTQSSVPAVTF